jgi:hypothetical protein
VDSHGQSEVAFAFCRLLGFLLLPRLKNIGRQRLYRPLAGQPDAYPRLLHVLSRPIDWELIRQQYDEMVKYATALRLGTAETEAILRRFTRNNLQHPTYRALAELGKAVKTIFLYVTWNQPCSIIGRFGRKHDLSRVAARSLASTGRRAAGTRLAEHSVEPRSRPAHARRLLSGPF